jgi:ornithine cyclodeaminase/alanine dehydrogenase-like protein (mu-crystallin family)
MDYDISHASLVIGNGVQARITQAGIRVFMPGVFEHVYSHDPDQAKRLYSSRAIYSQAEISIKNVTRPVS